MKKFLLCVLSGLLIAMPLAAGGATAQKSKCDDCGTVVEVNTQERSCGGGKETQTRSRAISMSERDDSRARWIGFDGSGFKGNGFGRDDYDPKGRGSSNSRDVNVVDECLETSKRFEYKVTLKAGQRIFYSKPLPDYSLPDFRVGDKVQIVNGQINYLREEPTKSKQ